MSSNNQKSRVYFTPCKDDPNFQQVSVEVGGKIIHTGKVGTGQLDLLAIKPETAEIEPETETADDNISINNK